MTSKQGKLYFTDQQIRGKRFYSKHMIQIDLKATQFVGAVGSKNGLLKCPKPYLMIEEVNQLVNTILLSESLPKRVSKRGLTGVLKDINWWTSTFESPNKTFIQLVSEKSVQIKRLRKGVNRKKQNKGEENERKTRLKRKRKIADSSTETDELAPRTSTKLSVGGRGYKRLKLEAQLSQSEKLRC